MNAGIRDTAAWHVIEQLLEHIWGPNSSLSDDEILVICKLFTKAGGKWKDVIDGSADHIGILNECIGNVLTLQKLSRVAVRIARGIVNNE